MKATLIRAGQGNLVHRLLKWLFKAYPLFEIKASIVTFRIKLKHDHCYGSILIPSTFKPN